MKLSATLTQELRRRGVVITDLDAFWETAAAYGELNSGHRSVYAMLRARYTPEGRVYRIYREIAAEWGVRKQAVNPAIQRALDALACPEQVVRYGHYVDVATVSHQPPLSPSGRLPDAKAAYRTLPDATGLPDA